MAGAAVLCMSRYGRYSVTFNETETGAMGQVYPAWWLRNPEAQSHAVSLKTVLQLICGKCR